MIETEQLTTLDLTERQSLAEVAATVAELVQFQLRRESFEFLRALEQALQQVERTELGPLSFEYDQLLTKLRLTAFADLAEEEAVAVLAAHVVDIFSTTLDLHDRLQQRLVDLVLYEDRDAFKKKVRDAFIRNPQPLTGKTLELGEERRPVSPTVANWMRVYTFSVGSGIADPLQLSQFYSREPNIMKLSLDERKRVRTIFGIYERFKYPSDVVEGLDGAVTIMKDGKTYFVSDGEVTLVKGVVSDKEAPRVMTRIPSIRQTKVQKAPVTAKTISDRVHDLNAARAADDRKRYETEERLVEAVGSDVGKLVEVLKTSLSTKDNDTVKACVFVFARLGLMHAPLGSKGVSDLFAEEFLHPLADHAAVPFEKVRAALEAKKDDRQFIGTFLQWMLHRSVANDEAESARLGNVVENTIVSLGSPEYTGLTYFDTGTNCFRWTPLTVKQDGTVAEAA